MRLGYGGLAGLALALAGLTPLRAASLSCTNDCSHHGECSDGVCVCEAAFTGALRLSVPHYDSTAHAAACH